jgi:hypothetical protein
MLSFETYSMPLYAIPRGDFGILIDYSLHVNVMLVVVPWGVNTRKEDVSRNAQAKNRI